MFRIEDYFGKPSEFELSEFELSEIRLALTDAADLCDKREMPATARSLRRLGDRIEAHLKTTIWHPEAQENFTYDPDDIIADRKKDPSIYS
jgi:hypothetical protein